MEVVTCHASDDCRCFDDVTRLHVLRSNYPPFPVASSHERDISRPTFAMARIRLGVQEVDSQCNWSGSSACSKAELTCMGRIAPRQPSPQRADPFCPAHNSASESQSFGIFVYGLRQCRASESFLRGTDRNDDQKEIQVKRFCKKWV